MGGGRGLRRKLPQISPCKQHIFGIPTAHYSFSIGLFCHCCGWRSVIRSPPLDYRTACAIRYSSARMYCARATGSSPAASDNCVTRREKHRDGRRCINDRAISAPMRGTADDARSMGSFRYTVTGKLLEVTEI